MNRNLIIVLLIVSLLLSIAFGGYQKMRADENKTLAILNERLAKEMALRAEQQMKLAEEQRRIAEVNAMEALRQRQIALELLNKKRSN